MRGGRGFSRGNFPRGGGSSYRGSSGSSYRGGGGSNRGGSGGGGGGYSGGKGRYNYDNSYGSSSHGARYNSGNQYGNRDHSGGPPFKRRPDRDFRSPDRKRIRNDHHQTLKKELKLMAFRS